MATLQAQYPWTAQPLVVGAPMRFIALPELAVDISAAGGFGFIGAGDAFDKLEGWLQDAERLVKKDPKLSIAYKKSGILPVGIGIFNWTSKTEHHKVINVIDKWCPAALWQFGAVSNSDYVEWAKEVRALNSGKTKIWVQVGSVKDAVQVARSVSPDVLVIQGTDAGGHGLEAGAGIISLVPEVKDALVTIGKASVHVIAAGGIVEGRGTAAALMLGAEGVCLGTRFLASHEAVLSSGYQQDIIRCSDGGLATARTKLYDQLRGTIAWPTNYNARGVLNQSFQDHHKGMDIDQNKTLYQEAMEKGDSGWGEQGRMTTYAGTGIGLIREVRHAKDIVLEIQQDTIQLLNQAHSKL